MMRVFIQVLSCLGPKSVVVEKKKNGLGQQLSSACFEQYDQHGQRKASCSPYPIQTQLTMFFAAHRREKQRVSISIHTVSVFFIHPQVI